MNQRLLDYTDKTAFPIQELNRLFPNLENQTEQALEFLMLIESLINRAVSEALIVVDQAFKKELAQQEKQTMLYLIKYRNLQDLQQFRPDTQQILLKHIDTHLPLECHSMLIERTRKALFEKGIACRVVWMDKENYSNWLKNNNLTDSDDNEATRATWAADINKTH